MSIYFQRGKGWRYDFTLKGIRYTKAWFKTKNEAKMAEARRKEEILNPIQEKETQTDMDFLELVNRRLDHLKAYSSASYYRDHIYMAKRWVKRWKNLSCGSITTDEIQSYILKRSKFSHYVANYELRCLRATFNLGVRRKWITTNPTQGIPFLPVEKRVKYIPTKEDILRVIMAADPDTQDYLWTIKETMGRVGEINRLKWNDINFEDRSLFLYTRKKKGGHLTPRKVPMTNRLFQVLSRRFEHRDKRIPWVFWHRYWDPKKQEWIEGPYRDRKRIMKALCKRAGVRYFRFHPIRHLGASILDSANVSLGTIQRILGHENRTTTEIYLHSIRESEREAMKIYEELTEKSHTISHTENKKELARVG